MHLYTYLVFHYSILSIFPNSIHISTISYFKCSFIIYPSCNIPQSLENSLDLTPLLNSLGNPWETTEPQKNWMESMDGVALKPLSYIFNWIGCSDIASADCSANVQSVFKKGTGKQATKRNNNNIHILYIRRTFLNSLLVQWYLNYSI